jgi:hypothetical protein
MIGLVILALGAFFLWQGRKLAVRLRRSLHVMSWETPARGIDAGSGHFVVTVILTASLAYLSYVDPSSGLLCGGVMVAYGLAAPFAVRRLFALQRQAALARAAASQEFSEADFGFFLSAPDLKTPWHFQMWEEHLHSSGRKVIFFTTERRHFNYVRKHGRTPAVLTYGANAITSFCSSPTTIRAMFYANNSYVNGWVIKAMTSVEHIQLLHGDSDKPPSYNPVARMYDKLFVAGRMAIDRYSRHGVTIPDERFEIVGRPQVSAIRQVGDPRKTIVYMPTWRGFYSDTQFSSLDRGGEIIEMILGQDQPVEILFKSHPMSRKDPKWAEFRAEIQQALGARRENGNSGKFAPETMDPFDAYNAADVLICDISSVMIDFLYSGKPLCVIDPIGFSEEELKEFPSLESAYRIKSDLTNLVEVVQQALNSDPLKPKRLEVRDYAFGDLELEAGQAFTRAIEKLVVAT